MKGPGIPRPCVSLGDNSDVFRGSLNIARRKRPVRHLVAVSNELVLTRHGGDMNTRRTVLASEDPEFMLYRIGIRFGLRVLPEWSEWFAEELVRRRAVRMLVGLGCRPVLVTGTKKRFLGWIGHALKWKRISIPAEYEATAWKMSSDFDATGGGGQAATPPRCMRWLNIKSDRRQASQSVRRDGPSSSIGVPTSGSNCLAPSETSPHIPLGASMEMPPKDIREYLRIYAPELAERIAEHSRRYIVLVIRSRAKSNSWSEALSGTTGRNLRAAAAVG